MCVFLYYLGLFASFAFCLIFRILFFFQAEDGIRDVERSRGLGDVYKRQGTKSENTLPDTSVSYVQHPYPILV